MAKKARKKTSKKKTKSAVSKKKTRAVTKKRKSRKSRPKGLGQRVSSAYHTVVDSVKGTDRLRNKMEQPGTSESE
jgi:hypothetical protein